MILLHCYCERGSHIRNKKEGNRLLLGTDFPSSVLTTGRTAPGKMVAASFFFPSSEKTLLTHVLKDSPFCLIFPYTTRQDASDSITSGVELCWHNKTLGCPHNHRAASPVRVAGGSSSFLKKEEGTHVPGRTYQALARILAPSKPFLLYNKVLREVGVSDRVGKVMMQKEVDAGFLTPHSSFWKTIRVSEHPRASKSSWEVGLSS